MFLDGVDLRGRDGCGELREEPNSKGIQFIRFPKLIAFDLAHVGIEKMSEDLVVRAKESQKASRRSC